MLEDQVFIPPTVMLLDTSVFFLGSGIHSYSFHPEVIQEFKDELCGFSAFVISLVDYDTIVNQKRIEILTALGVRFPAILLMPAFAETDHEKEHVKSILSIIKQANVCFFREPFDFEWPELRYPGHVPSEGVATLNFFRVVSALHRQGERVTAQNIRKVLDN